MAGRILPVVLATIVGVSIGVATFDGEFKKQRMARMEEEYKRELAAAAASSSSNTTDPSPVATRASTPPMPEPLRAKKEEMVASTPADNSWSNVLGLWAWKKDTKKEAIPITEQVTPVKSQAEEAKRKP